MHLIISLLVIAIVIVGFVVFVATRQADFNVARSLKIDAPAAAIFPFVDDLPQHERWSPFTQLDPAMKRTYTGDAATVGTSLHWTGNNRAGEGRMTLTEIQPESRLAFRLEFLRPLKATNQAVFTFEPQGEGTVVTWSMTGHNNFICKAFSVFMDCDKMCGPQFEQGLAQLKTLAETSAVLTLAAR